MPVPVLRELRERLLRVRFYNCATGRARSPPLATVLRPEELNEERLASVGRPARRARGDSPPLPAPHGRLLGEAGRDRGGLRGRLVPFRRPRLFRRGGLPLRGGPGQGRD